MRKIKKTEPLFSIDMDNVMEHIGYFMEHLEELLIDTTNPLKRAAFFGLIFDSPPTYANLTSGTPKLAPYLGIKPSICSTLVPIGDPTVKVW